MVQDGATPAKRYTPGKTWTMQLHAATLAGDGVASHRSAARLLGLPVPAERVEITVPLGRQVRLPGVVAHRSNLLLPSLITTVDGIACTTPERTLIDLTSVLMPSTCERAVDEAVRRRLGTYTSLDGCYRLMRRRGRRRVTVVQDVLSRRLGGVEPGDSEWEMRIAGWLVEAGFGPPEQAFWTVAGGERFCLDLAYPAARVAVEFDGWESHRLRGRYDADRRKWRRLELEGWTVLPFTSICTRKEVVDDVGLALRRAA
ncbi:MAG TPA: hypothetical protein VHE80_06415, partial [Acidimicrobiales bacterium]|nr:hypothetical protein [Acidimicrobiales bacterium]